MIFEKPHRRLNLLTNEWVLVSPQRTKRPWLGKEEKSAQKNKPVYDPECYLCPGNRRANGEVNPGYESTYVFVNDFSALLPEPVEELQTNNLLRSQTVSGECRVICFSPKHNLTLAEMPPGEIKKVVDVWIEQLDELGAKYPWVQIFENKGEMMGASNPHPHGQVWAGSFIPNEIKKEDQNQFDYYKSGNSILLLDYLKKELQLKERIVVENSDWVVLVPFWAVWPYETLLIPKRHVVRLTGLDKPEKESLAEILKQILVRYDNLFETSFPYTFGWHGAPTDGNDYAYWQLHAHFYPPLLRSATVKKFMVGYEMLAEAQRDITAEQAAGKLKSLPDVHYLGL